MKRIARKAGSMFFSPFPREAIAALAVFFLLLAASVEAGGGTGLDLGRRLAAEADLKPAYPPEVYEGEHLYDYLNGGADAVLEYGLTGLAAGEYERGGAAFLIEVYRAATPRGALGLFLSGRPQEAREAALGWRGYVSAGGAAFWKGLYCFRLSVLPGSRANPDEGYLAALAARLAKYPAESSPPADPFAALPETGRVPGSEKMALGSLALRDVLPLPRENLLALSAARPALMARYTVGDAGVQAWAVRVDYSRAPLARRAEKALVRYAEEERGLRVSALEGALKLVESGDGPGGYSILVGCRGGVLAAVRGRAEARVLAKVATAILD